MLVLYVVKVYVLYKTNKFFLNIFLKKTSPQKNWLGVSYDSRACKIW